MTGIIICIMCIYSSCIDDCVTSMNKYILVANNSTKETIDNTVFAITTQIQFYKNLRVLNIYNTTSMSALANYYNLGWQNICDTSKLVPNSVIH